MLAVLMNVSVGSNDRQTPSESNEYGLETATKSGGRGGVECNEGKN